jgi:HSP20 family protein
MKMAGLIPFGRRHGLSRGFDGLDFWDGGFMRNFFNGSDGFTNFKVDVKDKDDRYEVDADLPGLHREMIDVSYDEGILTISADMNEESKTEKDNYVVNERRMGRVSRSFSVSDVKEDEITAEYKDGVLKVVLPKSGEEKKKSRKIDIR